MYRNYKYILLIIVLVLIEILLIISVPILEAKKYPLLSSLLCIQTQSIEDLYWNINQINLTGNGSNSKEPHSTVRLTHNVPNFASYYFRTDKEAPWVSTKDSTIALKLKEGNNLFEVKAKNMFGEETPPVQYRIIKIADLFKITSKDERIIQGKYNFRFETHDSPKIERLRKHTLPVVAGYRSQWKKYIALRKWVREQIPFKYPSVKSHWDALRILQTVWGDAEVGFQCGEYAATYTSACISVGLNARVMHLKSIDGRGHNATEVWSDDYNKWVFMDPLFDWYFTIGGRPLSALELHNLWKAGEWYGVNKNDGYNSRADNKDMHDENYFSLFQDIQLVSANDFLSNPFTSVIDLLTFKIRYIRWIDASNPQYNKTSLAFRLIAFYYLPKLSKVFIIPVFIPFLIIVMSILFLRRTYKSSYCG